jgi:hypothetical protein
MVRQDDDGFDVERMAPPNIAERLPQEIDVIDETMQAALSQIGREEKAAAADEVSRIVRHRASIALSKRMGFAALNPSYGLFCFPPELALTAEQAANIVTRAAEKTTRNIDDMPIAIILLKGLKETFPCVEQASRSTHPMSFSEIRIRQLIRLLANNSLQQSFRL